MILYLQRIYHLYLDYSHKFSVKSSISEKKLQITVKETEINYLWSQGDRGN